MSKNRLRNKDLHLSLPQKGLKKSERNKGVQKGENLQFVSPRNQREDIIDKVKLSYTNHN